MWFRRVAAYPSGEIRTGGFIGSPHGYVFCNVTDNCNAARNALERVRRSRGIVLCGDVSHAFSKCYQHILGLPQIKPFVKQAKQVADLFLTYSQPMGMLQSKSKKRLQRLVETRFVSGHAMMQSQVDLKNAMIEVIYKEEFTAWVAKQKPEVNALVAKVKATLNDELYWKMLKFLLHLGKGFVVAVRMFDRAKSGSACLVYKTWSLLGGTMVAAFEESKGEPFVTQDLYEAIQDKIKQDWKKFHYPVFAAAFFGTPQFREELSGMASNEEEQYQELRDQTIEVAVTMMRRFAFEDGVELRQVILNENDPILDDFRAQIEDELDAYVSGEGRYLKVRVGAALAPSGGLLKKIMCRVTSLVPSTSNVEREHKLFKATRTKYRNLLSYCRAFAVNFIASRYRTEVSDAELDWEEVSHFQKRISELSLADHEFLERIAEEARVAEREELELREEEGREPNDATVELSAALNSLGPSADPEQEEEEELEPETPMVSSYGRVIRRKLFPEFVPNGRH
ncbi:hypothetical protein BASA81_016576 [Batrachochytrium salamandrivorans]|nr:hypothetical protein BASA81_016576 [Batrachochytrium salamandrivorans]